MKKIIVIIIAALISMSAFAQSSKNIYNKYTNKPKVTSIYVSPSMFKLMGKVPQVEGADFSSVIQSLDAMYVLECEDAIVASELKYDIIRYVKSKQMELMMEAKEEDEVVSVYTVSEGDYVSNFVILISEHDECTFIGIEGKLNQETLGQVISKMDM